MQEEVAVRERDFSDEFPSYYHRGNLSWIQKYDGNTIIVFAK